MGAGGPGRDEMAYRCLGVGLILLLLALAQHGIRNRIVPRVMGVRAVLAEGVTN